MATFAETLTTQRQRAGLSMRQLALKGGLDPSTISLLERGQRKPTRASTLQIAEALGLSERGTDQLLVAAGFVPTHRAEQPGSGFGVWQTPVMPAPADAARWAEFCRTVDLRIAAARAEAPKMCRSCAAVEGPTVRRCYRCKSVKPLLEFCRDAGKPYGFNYLCRDCKAAASRGERQARKRRQFRAILGRAS